MKRLFLFLALGALIAGGAAGAEVDAQEGEVSAESGNGREGGPGAAVRGYVDRDGDGVNDRFADADGDGIDDVSGEPYPHRFRFADGDGDGVNDQFTDADGDGVNDRDARFVDGDGDGTCDNVIDYDGDGINDITGLQYTSRSLQGYRYGRVDEERGRLHRSFVNEDGDGIRDLHGPGPSGRRSGIDYFVDEDGDGICDGRAITGRPTAPREPQGRGWMRGGEPQRRGGGR